MSQNPSGDRRPLALAFSGNDATTDILERAAHQHAEDSCEPDHEVGDLEVYLRAAIVRLTPEQRRDFYKDDGVRECLAIGLGAEDDDLEAIANLLSSSKP